MIVFVTFVHDWIVSSVDRVAEHTTGGGWNYGGMGGGIVVLLFLPPAQHKPKDVL